MLRRLRMLAHQRASFAFETTLASRTFAPWLRGLAQSGYTFHVLYVWVSHPDIAVQRVTSRFAAGGHHVPEETVRRRYVSGVKNFFSLYRPLTATWRVYDNTSGDAPVLVAAGRGKDTSVVLNTRIWESILRTASNGPAS